MSGGSPLGRILRRGAARNGVHHWVALHQVTSYALLPLTLWFLFALLSLPSLAYADVIAFIATPWHAVLLVLLIATTCRHSELGVQVVIEDYVHAHGLKVAALRLSQFAHVLVAAAGIYPVLKIAFGAH